MLINKNTFEGGTYSKGGAYIWKEGAKLNHYSISLLVPGFILVVSCVHLAHESPWLSLRIHIENNPIIFSYVFSIASSVSSTVIPFLNAVVLSCKEPRTRKESLWRPLSSKSAWKITILRRISVSVVLWSWRTFLVPSSRSVFLVMPHTVMRLRQMTSLAWMLKLWKSWTRTRNLWKSLVSLIKLFFKGLHVHRSVFLSDVFSGGFICICAYVVLCDIFWLNCRLV